MCLFRFASMVRVKGVTMSGKCATTLPCFSRAGGPSLGAWRHPMLMVDTDAVVVEARLLVGELGCPTCGGMLRPWGHARWRFSRRQEGTVRHRPRRASCTGCSKTHVGFHWESDEHPTLQLSRVRPKQRLLQPPRC